MLSAALILGGGGCRPSPILSDVIATPDTISPNGDGHNDEATITYSLSRNARVSIIFQDGAGREYPFRKDELRSPGHYTAKLDGAYYPTDGAKTRRIMADGRYSFIVKATDDQGAMEEKTGVMNIVDADDSYPAITDVIAHPNVVSPNGDALDDETIISYSLSKASRVTIYSLDGKGGKYLMEAPNQKSAALHSHRWNGTAGGEVLPDGLYTVYIQAADKAGNLTETPLPITITGGGTPKLEIIEASFTPPALPLGGPLKVEIRVKNTGNATLRTIGPPPGTEYTTDMNFNYWKAADGQTPLYYERAGFWRIGVGWNLADRPYPIRWSLGKDLAPGEEATITGSIRVLIPQTREVYFWAATIQEGVGFGGQVGIKKIVISY